LTRNQLSVEGLLEKIGFEGKNGVPISKFARFLKDKVEKNKDLENLESYADLMDVDKDGRICKDDLQTCLCNVGSDQFFKNGGQNLKHT